MRDWSSDVCSSDLPLIEMLTERVDADLVQTIGRNALLWKRNFDKPKIELP